MPGSPLTTLSSAGPSWRAATLRHGRSLAPSHAHLVCASQGPSHGVMRDAHAWCITWREMMHHVCTLWCGAAWSASRSSARAEPTSSPLCTYAPRTVCAFRHVESPRRRKLYSYCTVHPQGTQHILGGPPQRLRRAGEDRLGRGQLVAERAVCRCVCAHLPLAVEAELRAGHELVAEGWLAVDLGGEHTVDG